MLPRVLEAEVMDAPEEAAEYDAMTHGEVNACFAADALAARGIGKGGRWLDVGTGTARIPIELARRDPTIHVTAVDLSRNMLEIGRRNVHNAALEERVELDLVDAKGLPYPDASFECVVCNSIVHHIPDPTDCLRELLRLVAPDGTLFVRDLVRPPTDDAVEALVALHAGTDSERGRALLRDSLHAALSIEEVRAIVRSLGERADAVAATSDRHWTWSRRFGDIE